MRILAVATVIGLLVTPHWAAAQEKKPQTGTPEAPISGTVTRQESEAQAAERRKAEELAKARQRRVDRLSKSICSGC
jgi:transposase